MFPTCRRGPGSMASCRGRTGPDGLCDRHRPPADPQERLRRLLDPLGDYVAQEVERERRARGRLVVWALAACRAR